MNTYQTPGAVIGAEDRKSNDKVSVFPSSSHCHMKRKRVNKKT